MLNLAKIKDMWQMNVMSNIKEVIATQSMFEKGTPRCKEEVVTNRKLLLKSIELLKSNVMSSHLLVESLFKMADAQFKTSLFLLALSWKIHQGVHEKEKRGKIRD